MFLAQDCLGWFLSLGAQEELPNGCSPDTKWKPTEDFEPRPQRLVFKEKDVIQRYPIDIQIYVVEVFSAFREFWQVLPMAAQLQPPFAQGHSFGRQSGTLLLGTI